jgi:lysophospholipid acyltransferase (LPLAT)-like uncharacterized protein
MLRGVLGGLVGVVARLWLATLRVEVLTHPSLAAVGERAWILSFFHGTQWPLLAWKRRRPTFVMVSWSRDGSLQASALGVLGFSIVRGSSSRGGMRGLASVVRGLKASRADAAFAVDGPRGPYGVAKGGARLAARAAGGVLVPIGSAFARGLVFRRAWDRFGVAWPFSRVVVCLGAPIEPGASDHQVDVELGAAIARVNADAQRRIDERGAVLALAAHEAGAVEPKK